jgi:hypothetical protein
MEAPLTPWPADHALEQAAAVTDNSDGIVEAQRTGDMGSGASLRDYGPPRPGARCPRSATGCQAI